MQIKRKFLLFLVGLLSFLFLFYYKDPGGNILIFCAVAWYLTAQSQGGFKAFKTDTGFWLLSLAMWLTAGAFTFYGDAGSMFGLVLSFYVLGVYMTDRTFHPLIYPLMLAYSFGTFVVRIFFVERWIPKRNNKKESATAPFEAYEASLTATATTQTAGHIDSSDPAVITPPTKSSNNGAAHTWIKTWLIPIIIALLFLVVYMASSTMFADVLTRLLPNLDFKVLFALSLIGFILLFNFMYILPIPWLYTVNEKVKGWDKIQHQPIGQDKEKAAAHQKGAVITLSLLIGLLALFLIVYSYELYQGIQGARLSKAVHEQVNSIILSIVMAVLVIMYYIRPEPKNSQAASADASSGQSAAAKSTLLRKLAYTWIILNTLLVLSAASHNVAYIGHYGLTLLRVGVYIFLFLCLVGLFFTYRKIKNERSAASLVAIMFKIFLATIALNSTINWSAIVTRYDLTYMANPDLHYLRSLDYNIHVLYPRLMEDPKYKKDAAWVNELNDERHFTEILSRYPVLSRVWYNKYAVWKLNNH